MKKRNERILVVDDEPGICRLLKAVLEDGGYAVTVLQDPAEAVASLKGAPDAFSLVITDVRMPKVDGMDVLKAARAAGDIPVVLITAHGTVETAVEAMRLGASDYVLKPFKNEEIKIVVERLLETRRLLTENARLQQELAAQYRFGEIVGRSRRIQDVFLLLGQLSRTDATVLIEGESGTGKELAARAVHFNGPRAAGPFVVVHCGALPEPLMESELFGHVKGAFTDATRDRMGLLESAEGGTVLLDEIGEMPAALQVKLLRFLQDREVRRVGSTESRRVDVRVIAATNKNLRSEVENSRFRVDLFYRLAVVPVQLPPLRERKEDIPLMIEHFLERAAARAGKKGFSLSAESMSILLAHDWPGNVRELENAIAHAAALGGGSDMGPEVLPRRLTGAAPPAPASVSWRNVPYREAKQRILESFDRAYLTDLLRRCGGSVTRAAAEADMDRKNFYDLLKKYGLSPREPSPDSSDASS
jgi:DNA-binding NtrC family response regulator